jgi:hypothetical protein
VIDGHRPRRSRRAAALRGRSSTSTVLFLLSALMRRVAGANPVLAKVSVWVLPARTVQGSGVVPSDPEGPTTLAPGGRVCSVSVIRGSGARRGGRSADAGGASPPAGAGAAPEGRATAAETPSTPFSTRARAEAATRRCLSIER